MKIKFLSLLTMIMLGAFCMVSCGDDFDSDDESKAGSLYINGEKWDVHPALGASYADHKLEFQAPLIKDGDRSFVNTFCFSVRGADALDDLEVGDVDIVIFNFANHNYSSSKYFSIESGTTTVLEKKNSSIKIKFDNLTFTATKNGTSSSYVINGTIVFKE